MTPRQIVDACIRDRQLRLREVERGVSEGRARWGRLRVLSYNDDTGRVRVIDESEKGDGMIRSYVVAIEAITIEAEAPR